MAYDLLLRRHVPTNFAREGGAPAMVTGGIAVLAAVGLLVIPRARRRAEIRRYRREYASDLDVTQELPAIPMAELIKQPWHY